MRDKTADPNFQVKKQIGFELERRYPELFIPRYSMVMFHPDIPYAYAQKRSLLQAELLDRLCRSTDCQGELDWDALDGALREVLSRKEPQEFKKALAKLPEL